MGAERTWEDVCGFVNNKAALCWFASADAQGRPHVTPIGSFFLTAPGRGFYFEHYPKTMRGHFRDNAQVTILAQGGSRLAFLWAMLVGHTSNHAGIRLFGTVGGRRDASPGEFELFRRRVRFFRPFRGCDILWGGMRRVRDVALDDFERLELGRLHRRSMEAA